MKLARRPVALLAGLTALALAATGCAANLTPEDLTGVISLNPVAPAGMLQGSAALAGAQTAPDDCGDPTRSLTPQGLPGPGAMPSGSTMQTIYQRGYLIAGVDQSTYLWGYLNPLTSQLEGFDIDVVNAVARAIFGPDIANRVQFRAITSGQRVGALTGDASDPQVDMVVRTFTINCQREEQGVRFSSVYYDAQERLLVAKDSTVQTVDDLGGKKVCAAAGSTSIVNIANAPSKPKPVSVPDWTDCLVMLQQGQVDAISTDDTILVGLAAQDPTVKLVGSAFTNEPYGLGIAPKDDQFTRFVNGVLANIRSNGRWAAIYQRWLGGTGVPPAAHYRD